MKTYQEIEKISQQHGTPFYIFDREVFIRNFNKMRSAFMKRYSRVIVGYSYKTNYIPYICNLVRDMGGYAEVVSRLELDLALKIGCSPSKIIYNGPVKTADDLAFAMNLGITVNLDTLREFEIVSDMARLDAKKSFCIGLRINVPLIDNSGKSHLQNEYHSARFGFTEDMLNSVVSHLENHPNIKITSLHGHTSSSTRSLWVYRTIANKLAEVGGAYFAETVEFINVGGGFYGHPVPAMGLSDPPTFDAYAEAICEVFHHHPWIVSKKPQLVIEPGMAVVSDAMSFVTRVFDIKCCGDQLLAVVDGSIFNVKPTFHMRNHPYAIIGKSSETTQAYRYSVVGSTCMEKDRLLQDIDCIEIHRGDFISIENVGAYTVVLTPPFIQLAPPVLVYNTNEYVAIRRRQNFDEFFSSYTFDNW